MNQENKAKYDAINLKIAMDTKILLAIERLYTAQSYGSDMPGSKALAVRDAMDLLFDAICIHGQTEGTSNQRGDK